MKNAGKNQILSYLVHNIPQMLQRCSKIASKWPKSGEKLKKSKGNSLPGISGLTGQGAGVILCPDSGFGDRAADKEAS